MNVLEDAVRRRRRHCRVIRHGHQVEDGFIVSCADAVGTPNDLIVICSDTERDEIWQKICFEHFRHRVKFACDLASVDEAVMGGHNAREQYCVVWRSEQVLLLDVGEKLVRLLSKNFEVCSDPLSRRGIDMKEDSHGGTLRLKHPKSFFVECDESTDPNDLDIAFRGVRHVVHYEAIVEMVLCIFRCDDYGSRARCGILLLIADWL